MHELSIAMAIAEAAAEEAGRNGNARVAKVYLKLGQMVGVVKSSLFASYEMAAEMCDLAGSELVIDEVPVAAFCPKCQLSRPVVSLQEIRCSECGTPTPDITAGRELEVTAIEIFQ
ncbi:MAG TPA: hydrogenase maturation nickel metallochaperone HypA [Tepidisphaeraceae bacterium]|jgi:hydrogenase nickel incorporation protein HypA/HybF